MKKLNFSDEVKLEIYNLYETTQMTNADLAQKYGICVRSIVNIRKEVELKLKGHEPPKQMNVTRKSQLTPIIKKSTREIEDEFLDSVLSERNPKTGDKGLINRDKGLINRDKGLINRDKGLINRDKGLINSDKGLINSDKGLINSDKGLINSDLTKNPIIINTDVEYDIAKPYVKSKHMDPPKLFVKTQHTVTRASDRQNQTPNTDKPRHVSFQVAGTVPEAKPVNYKKIELYNPPAPNGSRDTVMKQANSNPDRDMELANSDKELSKKERRALIRNEFMGFINNQFQLMESRNG